MQRKRVVRVAGDGDKQYARASARFFGKGAAAQRKDARRAALPLPPPPMPDFLRPMLFTPPPAIFFFADYFHDFSLRAARSARRERARRSAQQRGAASARRKEAKRSAAHRH
jgi:hypothetical protein